MIDFCKQKNVSIKDMKRHYYRNQPTSSQKAIDIKSADCSNKKEFILIESLAALVRDIYNLDPFSDSVFIFSNKKRKSIKILHWCVNGFELYMKTINDKSKY